MSLFKFFKIMGIVTILALTYIHMQLQIIDFAYQGYSKEKQIKKLVEENGNAKYKILMLKSANHLGGTMLEDDSDMQFADFNDVVQIAASDELLNDGRLEQPSTFVKNTNPLLSLLSFGDGAEAEARIAE